MIGRIRSVKPEFFQHYNLWLMERLTALPMRIGFQAVWSLCDREGRFEWKPQLLRLNGLPYDPCDPAKVLDALFVTGYVGKFANAERTRQYGFVLHWKHQSINARETATRIPTPPKEAIAQAANLHTLSDLDMQGVLDRAGLIAQEGLSNLRSASTSLEPITERADASGTRGGQFPDVCSLPFPVVDAVVSTERTTDHLGDMGERELTNGDKLDRARGDLTRSDVPAAHASQNGLIVEAAAKSAALPAIRGARTHDSIMARLASVSEEVAAGARRTLATEQLRRLAAELVFSYWTVRFDHPKARLDDKRENRIMDRLEENDDDVSELLYALDGAFRDDRIMGKGKFAGEQRYDGIETILRDRAQVERFSNERPDFKLGKPHKAYEKYLAALRGEAGDEPRSKMVRDVEGAVPAGVVVGVGESVDDGGGND